MPFDFAQKTLAKSIDPCTLRNSPQWAVWGRHGDGVKNMRLNPLVRDYRAFLAEIIPVLESPQTRVYLDTSLLMWLIRVGADARAEFFSWVNSRPLGTVKVPVWAAHELHKHLSENTVITNVKKTLGDAEKKFEEFVSLAAERADNENCGKSGFPGRQDYITALMQSKSQFLRMSKAVNFSDAQMRAAAEEVIAFLNDRILGTDLRSVMNEIDRVGQFRYDHRVPPGFHDNKPENRFGDLIIWEEMMLDMEGASRTKAGTLRRRPLATNAILISRDKKTDWVAGANMIVSPDDRIEKANRDQDLDVTLPHPLLLHEFRVRTGADKVFVVHPAFLSTTLELALRQAGRPPQFRAWSAATHRPDLAVAISKTLEKIAPEVTAEPASASNASQRQPMAVAWETIQIRDLVSGVAAAEINASRNALPVDLPELIAGFIAKMAQGEITPVGFGQIIADLSFRGQSGWPEQLPIVLESVRVVDVNAAQLTLLAFLASAYFDKFGEALSRPRKAIALAGLTFIDDTQYSAAFGSLSRLLSSADIKLPYTPGGDTRIRYSLDLGPGPEPLLIRDIRIGSQSVLPDRLEEGHPRNLSTLLSRTPDQGCSGEELRALLAREFILPVNVLASGWDKKKLTWAADAGLARLDPFSDGGLSADGEIDFDD